MRKAIDFIRKCDANILHEISPSTVRYQGLFRLPLFLLVGTTGALSAICLAMMKCGTELLKRGDNSLLPLFLIGVGILFALVLLWVTNLAMKNYEQLEVIPVFQCANMVLHLLFSLVIL